MSPEDGVHHGGGGMTAVAESWSITVLSTHRMEGRGGAQTERGEATNPQCSPHAQRCTFSSRASLSKGSIISPRCYQMEYKVLQYTVKDTYLDHHISKAGWLNRNAFFHSSIDCKSKTQACEVRKPWFLWDWVHALFASPQLLVMAMNHASLLAV